MNQRRLGHGGPSVGAIGLGCMGMSWGYAESSRDDRTSIAVIHRALDEGVTLLDTADVYGDGHNERLLARALAGRRNLVVLATKGGMVVDDLPTRRMHRDATPAHLRAAIEDSLRRLATDVIDLYYLHRVDPAVGIEDSWGALTEAVAAGKVRTLGLSEVTVAEAEAAHRIHPVAAIQSELSLWTRDALRSDPAGDRSAAPAPSVVDWCATHGAAFVAFAPLGRGFLTGRITDHAQLEAGDFRAGNPRFQPAALAANLAIVEAVRKVADRRDLTPAQVAIAWALAQGPHVVPIPGTKREQFLRENLAAARFGLPAEDLAALDRVPAAAGTRY